MKRVIVSETENTEQETILGMSNLPASKLGLPVGIWVDDHGKDRNTGHNDPRIKVNDYKGDRHKTGRDKEKENNTYTLSISKTPKEEEDDKPTISSEDQQAVKQFVIDHYDDLMAHWNKEITTKELKRRLYIH